MKNSDHDFDEVYCMLCYWASAFVLSCLIGMAAGFQWGVVAVGFANCAFWLVNYKIESEADSSAERK